MQTEAYLSLAKEPFQSRCRALLEENTGWETLQQRFFELTDKYVKAEIGKESGKWGFDRENLVGCQCEEIREVLVGANYIFLNSS